MYKKMPKLPINYSKGLIYTIRCKDETITEEYIGSTTNFNQRKNSHKSTCNNEKDIHYNESKYKFIRNNGGWDNWDMIMVEEYPCENKRKLEMREEQVRVERQAKLNIKKAFVAETKKEGNKIWYEENKEKISEYKKKWNEENKEKISEKKKEYHEANKEKIAEKKKEYHEANKEKIIEKKKEYYEENKEKIIEKAKDYYKENKEQIIEKAKEYYEKNKEKLLQKKKEYYEKNKK